ncbi:hypothetical protein NDU88_000864 [Pleurodeles waltl]|uniref:Uncharacterized protein n=1 Tax=Pleurodeles waltl TaxID=8319 RepID=A0AAV7VUS0_PLEWA|nr:hypothetical protein NDU88_000864 [Pleurodeles waltl]
MADTAASLVNAKQDKILKAIADTWQDLHNQVDTVEVGLLHEDHKKLTGTVTKTESTLDEIRPAESNLEGQVWSLATKVQELEHMAKDYEG